MNKNLENIIQDVLSESVITSKDIKNFKSFKAGDKLENDAGDKFEILSISVKPSLKKPEVFINYKYSSANGETGTDLKTAVQFLATYFDLKY